VGLSYSPLEARARHAATYQHANQVLFLLLYRLRVALPLSLFAFRSKNGVVVEEKCLALRWWMRIFEVDLIQHHFWFRKRQPACHLYCDARGEPPRVSAVLFDGESVSTCDIEPPAALFKSWARREHNQIMSLEILSSSLGISSLAKKLRDRDVIVCNGRTTLGPSTRLRKAPPRALITLAWSTLFGSTSQNSISRSGLSASQPRRTLRTCSQGNPTSYCETCVPRESQQCLTSATLRRKPGHI